VEEAPGEDGGGDEEESKGLVAPEDAALVGAACLLGCLLLERLNAGLNHDD
jgi:hypothetical protein